MFFSAMGPVSGAVTGVLLEELLEQVLEEPALNAREELLGSALIAGLVGREVIG